MIKQFLGKRDLTNATRNERPPRYYKPRKKKKINIIKKESKTTFSEIAEIVKGEIKISKSARFYMKIRNVSILLFDIVYVNISMADSILK